ncbi:Uncharacterized protein FWK35_00026441 [Aphis craccivora]|uniref:Uncharacterized protein n=1 Tax=Aphis craccivora TaxID=307492 RepID=A0A6G0VV15_APHCR|nr:Uncharacterized protein FWK35_00026441 [Aphis craccivora]
MDSENYMGKNHEVVDLTKAIVSELKFLRRECDNEFKKIFLQAKDKKCIQLYVVGPVGHKHTNIWSTNTHIRVETHTPGFTSTLPYQGLSYSYVK